MKTIEKKLTKAISDVIPGGRVQVTDLPQCPEISLYLLNSDYPDRPMNKLQGARLMNEPMFWLFCWASGQALARYIMDHPQLIANKRVMDFGCGSGIIAIAAANAGAQKIWACDSDPCAIHATQLNCELNSVSVDVIEDWQSSREKLDIILASDVLYDSENLPLLHQFTGRAPEVLISDSRIKTLNIPLYEKIAQLKSATVPDLKEPDDCGQVIIYYGSQTHR